MEQPRSVLISAASRCIAFHKALFPSMILKNALKVQVGDDRPSERQERESQSNQWPKIGEPGVE